LLDLLAGSLGSQRLRVSAGGATLGPASPFRPLRPSGPPPPLLVPLRLPEHQLHSAHGGERALRDLIRPLLDAYYGHCFKRLCREALPWFYRQEGVAAAFEVGQYWSKTTQIDVVGLRDNN
jgi:hypothetical protein